MEQITKNFKLIAGVLVIIFSFLPFYTGVSGFWLLSHGDILSLLFVLVILLGAAALIFVSLVKDIEVTPKFKLSFLAKLAILAGAVLILVKLLLSSLGLLLVIAVALALFFEDKVVQRLKK
ncbi:MAG: hypothetical protein LBP63_10240 [Prevotellaceae bacterium]|jgi:uncharacterized membrane protein|nr:hypothetical protein [Prevotellaceae bacterium]